MTRTRHTAVTTLTRRIIAYLATSADGYIARPDSDVAASRYSMLIGLHTELLSTLRWKVIGELLLMGGLQLAE